MRLLAHTSLELRDRFDRLDASSEGQKKAVWPRKTAIDAVSCTYDAPTRRAHRLDPNRCRLARNLKFFETATPPILKKNKDQDAVRFAQEDLDSESKEP